MELPVQSKSQDYACEIKKNIIFRKYIDAEIFILYLLKHVKYISKLSWAWSTVYDNCDKQSELQSSRSDYRYTPQIGIYLKVIPYMVWIIMSLYGEIGYHVTLSEGHMIANHPI